MKIYTLLWALTAFAGSFSLYAIDAATQQEAVSGLNWTTNYTQALKQAKAENKPLFLFFTGSDWCPWCMKMDSQILATPDFQQAVEGKFIFVKLDFPRSIPQDEDLKKQNKALAKEFSIQGYPTVVLLDPDGKQIDKIGFEAGGGAKYGQKVLNILDAYNKKS